MGDSRYEPHYDRVLKTRDPGRELQEMDDEEVIQALAGASTHAPSPYLANVLASEALNRLRRARVVHEHIADGVFVLDAKGQIRSMNPASVAMLGYDPAQLRGRDLSEICAQTGEPGHRCVHRLVLDGAQVARDAEDTFVHAEGHVLRVSSNAAAIEREGEIDGVVVAWRDVTAALRERRRLEESEARYRSLFANSPDLVITLDRQGRVLAMNPAGERLTGMSAEELLGESVLPFIRPEDQERASAILKDAYDGRVRQAEFEVIRPDGTPLIYDALGVPIIVGDEVVGVHGVARNITHLRRLEEGVRVSMARHELIMAGVKDHAILLLSRTRAIESWNPGAERLFGWRAADVLGRPCADLFPRNGTGGPTVAAALDDAERVGRADIELLALRADGSTAFVSGCVNRVLDANGLAHGYVIVLRDTSPRRRAQMELKRALAVLDAFQSARDLLVEGVARTEEGRIVTANRALLELARRTRADLVGDTLASLFTGGKGDALPPELAGHPRDWTRARLRVPGGGDRGAHREVEVAMRPVEPVEGKPRDAWVVYVREASREAAA